jgi:four helix bundle protein
MENKQSAKSFKDLVVWQKAHKFVLDIYKITKCFPKEELYGLTSQMRRASVSIPANIAEGFKKKGKADKLRFYNIAQGSIEEMKYFLLLSNDLDYSNAENPKKDISEISKMIESYINKINDN